MMDLKQDTQRCSNYYFKQSGTRFLRRSISTGVFIGKKTASFFHLTDATSWTTYHSYSGKKSTNLIASQTSRPDITVRLILQLNK